MFKNPAAAKNLATAGFVSKMGIYLKNFISG